MNDTKLVPANEIRSFRQLLAWQEAMNLAVAVHRASRLLPSSERFELGRELRRSGTSIPSNVAEGFNRHSLPAYRSHVGIALGSAGELDTQVELALRLEYFKPDLGGDLLASADRVGRLLQGLWKSLR